MVTVVAVTVSRRRRAAIKDTRETERAAKRAQAEQRYAELQAEARKEYAERQAQAKKDAEAKQAAQLADQLASAREAVRQAERFLSTLTDRDKGHASDHGPTTLYVMEDVFLVADRAAYRNGPRVPTAIEQGTAFFTESEIRFVGPRRTVPWKMAKVDSVSWGADYVMVYTAGRNSVYGLGCDESKLAVLALALEWAQTQFAGGQMTELENKARELRAATDRVLADLCREAAGTATATQQ